MNLSSCAALAVALLLAACDPTSPAAVASIEIAPSTATIAPGDTLRFRAVTRNAQGAQVTGFVVNWRSSNTLVASIDLLGGLATAVGPGPATITAAVGDVTGMALLTVQQ
jgi:uncharacterized protein YjdB